MGKHFVLDYGGVVVDEYVVDGESGEFGEEDAPEGVRYGGIDVDQGE